MGDTFFYSKPNAFHDWVVFTPNFKLFDTEQKYFTDILYLSNFQLLDRFGTLVVKVKAWQPTEQTFA